jgi:hypothetical protein
MCKISQGVKTFKIFLSVFGGMYSCRVQNLRRHFKKWNACTCGHFAQMVLPFCSFLFGCFGLFMIGSVSSIKSSFENWERV